MSQDQLKEPIFIIGNPRSGTTLLRLMLTCHRNIIIVPECGFSVWLYDDFRDWSWNEVNLVKSFVPALARCRKFETWELDMEGLLAFIKSKRPSSYTCLASSVYEYYGLSRGETFTRWGDKTTFYVRCLPRIREVFPTSVVIHIVRDGRDVACSYRELGNRKLDGLYAPRLPTLIEAIAREWNDNITSVSEAIKHVDPRSVCEVRFEDLVRDPENTLRRICDFLREGFDGHMLHYYADNQRQSLEPRAFLAWKEKTLLPPTTSVVGRYERELSRPDVREFESIAGAALRQYGYLTE